jgi:hypothetical protein
MKTVTIRVTSKDGWVGTIEVRDEDAASFIRTVFRMGGKAVVVKN